MSSEVKSSLRDFVSLQRGTTYKGNLLGLPGPVLLGLASIASDGGFRRGAFKTYGGESPKKITLGPGDLYVSLKDVTQSGDLLGSVARVPEDIPAGRLTQDTVKLEFAGKPISKEYIYWLLRTPAYREYCRARGTGTTTLGLGRDDFLNFPVSEPTESDLYLVELLENLDDRIALLRETNATLEAVAQALFKSWFVDFDPVRAKMEGCAPEGIDEATAALFPDGFEESALGLVPRGWRAAMLSQCISETSQRVRSHSAVVLSAVQTGHLVKSAEHFTKRVHSEDISKYKAVEPYAFAYNPSRVNIGSIGINEFAELGAVSPIYVVFEVKNALYRYWLWHHLRTIRLRELIKKMSSGTVRQSLSYQDFSSIPVVLPSEQVLEVFDHIRRHLYGGYGSNLHLIDVLTEIRDTLLPRLISGQLRLPAAASQFSEAIA